MVSDIISSERTPLNSRIPRQELADKQFAVMDRDRRLTGRLRGQTNSPIANAGFELNNPWRVGISLCQVLVYEYLLTACATGGATYLLKEDCTGTVTLG